MGKIIAPGGGENTMGIRPDEVEPLDLFNALAKRIRLLEDMFKVFRQVLGQKTQTIEMLEESFSTLEKRLKIIEDERSKLIKDTENYNKTRFLF